MKQLPAVFRPILTALAALTIAGSLHGATLAIFPTGTTVDLTLTIDTGTSAVIGSDIRGLAGLVVTDPPIANGVLINDFGLFPAPSNQILGTDALTQTQFLLFSLDIGNLFVGGPGIEVPVSTTEVTSPITDPALLQFDGRLLFGFTPVSSSTVGNTQTLVLNLATVDQVAPEPFPFVLLGSGLAGCVLLRRRRR